MKTPFDTISVIGLGYVGLPMAATLASRGCKVIGVDTNESAVSRINAGRSHILEPDLDMILQGAVSAGMLRACTSPQEADAFLICVPTPVDDDNRPDLGAVDAAGRSIAGILKAGDLVVIESTGPVGITARMARLLKELRPDLTFPDEAPEKSDVLLAYCPERILPGQTLRELVDNARSLGGLDQRSARRAQELYKLFVKGRMVMTDAPSAEMAKLTENAFRDVNIAFANELSIICHRLNLNVWSVIKLANLHPRVTILSPGPGVGGHCIPIDPWFIVDSAPEEARLIRMAREVNDGKTDFVAARVHEKASRFKDPVIALLGLTYKANVDDLRDSPGVHLAEKLAKDKVGRILAVEPHLNRLPEGLGKGGVTLCGIEEALRKADIVVVLVAHDAFKEMDRECLNERVVIDTVGLLREPVVTALREAS